SLQLPDLCGLLWLFGNRPRPRPAVRLPAAGQFQPAIHFRLLLRVLDPVAYLAVVVAKDLSLHSARGEPERHCENLSQPDDRDDDRGSLARRQPELRLVGHAAWGLPGHRASVSEVLPDRPSGRTSHPDGRGFPLRDDALDLLQASELRPGARISARDVHAVE